MGDQRRPLQPGEATPAFTLPAVNRDGMVSLSDLRGRPFLIGFFRGLHCPFSRRQLAQLAAVQPALQFVGIETIAVINTPAERARRYFRHRPTSVVLLSDPDCLTHRTFGVPRIEFMSDGSGEQPLWPWRASAAQFEASRIDPTGELPEPTNPLVAISLLNAKDRFEMEEADHVSLAQHGTQLVGHFLLDADGVVRWVQIEAPDDPNQLSIFPTPAQLIAAATRLGK